MSVPFKKNKFANRGKKAEDAVASFLSSWAHESSEREFNRLVDTKAAGRTIKASAADFEFFALLPDRTPCHGLIEVKETEHEYRLARDKVPQLPRLRKREKCGGLCFVVVHHSTIGLWRVMKAGTLASTGDKGSWNLSLVPAFPTAKEALESFNQQVFM